MRKYTKIFADCGTHERIRTWEQFITSGYHENSMGFYCNGVPVGEGMLMLVNKSKHWVHTEGMRLGNKFRRKGHGVPLYLAIIRQAKKIGATRIYSSTGLNKFSTRMWKYKLAKLFEVKSIETAKRWRYRCRARCRRRPQFYIDL